MGKTLYDLIAANKWRTFGFIVLFSVILGLVGYALVNIFHWGMTGYILFGLFIILYNLVLYYNSDRMALALVRAYPADPAEHRVLCDVVEEVAIAAGVPAPRVYIIPASAPNAFATGRNPRHSSLAVTEGLLGIMNREELQGVVAHEMSHIQNFDILLMTVVAILGGLVVLFRDIFLYSRFLGGERRSGRSQGGGGIQAILVLIGLVLAILAPLVVALIRAAISRQREYLADAAGAHLTRNPEGLARALEKLARETGKLETATQATAHLFIASPFGQDRKSLASWFATHPPLEERVKRLRSLLV